jgi:hypothetical protein
MTVTLENLIWIRRLDSRMQGGKRSINLTDSNNGSWGRIPRANVICSSVISALKRWRNKLFKSATYTCAVWISEGQKNMDPSPNFCRTPRSTLRLRKLGGKNDMGNMEGSPRRVKWTRFGGSKSGISCLYPSNWTPAIPRLLGSVKCFNESGNKCGFRRLEKHELRRQRVTSEVHSFNWDASASNTQFPWRSPLHAVHLGFMTHTSKSIRRTLRGNRTSCPWTSTLCTWASTFWGNGRGSGYFQMSLEI